ncbi:MAG: MBL fold metallo-hydrolase [Steroidobacteraceae bacterium]
MSSRKRSGDSAGITTEGESFATPGPALHYAVEAAPPAGHARQIAPGVTWLRMPLPIDLNHINLWLIEDGDGWTLIDTGYPAESCAEVWRRLETEPLLRERPLRRILLTHFHPDHMGLAGWLQARYDGLAVGFAPRGADAARDMLSPMTPESRATGAAYLESHGFADAARFLEGLPRNFERQPLISMPRITHALRDGERIDIGAPWRVIEAEGHADAHQCFHGAAAGVLVSGDQVLPSISPNVSLSRQRWGTDPLGDFLASLDRLDALPPDTLVLPSHGRPFRGLHARTADLRAHHADQLQRLLAQLAQPRAAYELLPMLFGRRLPGFHRMLAIHECIAHLEHLVRRGEALRETDGAGLHRYRSA